MATMDWGKRNKAGRHTGRSYSRTEAKAKIRHNDAERRADPMVKHANREIDKSRTHLNYEIGPTKGMTYLEKCARLDARLDELGYPTDAEASASNKQRQWCMQGLITYPPEALRGDPVREREWFEAMADEVTDFFGEENVIAMYVDCDEGHYYTDARTGEIRRSLDHAHMDIISACEHSIQKKYPWFLTEDGKETLNEDEAARDEIRKPRRKYDDKNHAVRDVNPATGKPAPVYLTEDGSETFEESEAAIDVTYEPRYSRYESGRIRYKKKPKTTRYEITSDFQSVPRMEALNRKIEEMTLEKFGCKWLVKELNEPTPEDAPTAYTVEELKEQSLAKVNAEALAQATATIEANVEASKQTLKDAETTAEVVKNDAKRLKDSAETEAAAAKREAEEAATQRDNAKRTRDLYAGEAYIVTRSDGTREKHLGTKGLKKRNEELRTQNKDLHTENEGLLAENKRLRKANANLSAREAAVADRERRAKEQAEGNAKDAARNAAREKQLREGIAALKLAQETIADPTVIIEGEDADAYTARVVERTVLATADVFMRSTSPCEDVQRERRQLGRDLYAEADMAASMGTRMRLDDGSEGTLFSLVRDRVHAFVREPMGAIARAVDALSTRVRDYLAQAESALDFSSTFEDLNDEATGKPRTAKQQGQRTTRAVTAQRLVASIETGQSLDDIDSTPADDYGFGF